MKNIIGEVVRTITISLFVTCFLISYLMSDYGSDYHKFNDRIYDIQKQIIELKYR